MTADNPFEVIRDAISSAGGTGDRIQQDDADRCARAVLLALEHNGFEIVRHTPEPPDDD
jgi:hypothetical protein